MKIISREWKLLQAAALLFSLFWIVGGVVAAQTPIMLKSLEVELWPEFDRPETLVIYRAELAPTVTLPVEVTFRLPATVESMFVVAVERDGVLIQVNEDAFKLERADDAMLLTFSTPVPRIQFEYYDASILTKQGAERQLNFEVVASYPTEKALFQVQEPFQAEKFTLTPPASSTFTGTDGLTYAVVEIAGLARDETFTLTATYSRPTDTLSAQNLAGPTAEHAADLPAAAESPVAQPPANENLTLGYGLIGIGVTLLLGVAVYWLWSKKAAPAKARPASRRPKRTAKPVEASAPVTSPAAGPTRNFCYRCGVALREDANFCHSCGAERRRE
ncbi:MAG: zinc ribbon domain-containing protein [Anaerolineales bacterium]|nr:zinc ribbon domain-containing protein [Anaerolineales bacterium]